VASSRRKTNWHFVADVSNIYVKKRVRFQSPVNDGRTEETLAVTNITLQSVVDAFPALPVYTLQLSSLQLVDGNGIF
jgi:hypothetical protein